MTAGLTSAGSGSVCLDPHPPPQDPKSKYQPKLAGPNPPRCVAA